MSIAVKWALSFHAMLSDEYYCKVRLELSCSTKSWTCSTIMVVSPAIMTVLVKVHRQFCHRFKWANPEVYVEKSPTHIYENVWLHCCVWSCARGVCCLPTNDQSALSSVVVGLVCRSAFMYVMCLCSNQRSTLSEFVVGCLGFPSSSRSCISQPAISF